MDDWPPSFVDALAAPASREPLREPWHRIRLTVQEMNYAVRRVTEIQAPWSVDQQRKSKYGSRLWTRSRASSQW